MGKSNLLVFLLDCLRGTVVFLFQWMMPIEERCWFSGRFFDIHDYHFHKGGDDVPSHFREYTCWMCGKKFTI